MGRWTRTQSIPGCARGSISKTPVIEGWMKENGFSRMTVLNSGEKGKMRCAYHVLGFKDT